MKPTDPAGSSSSLPPAALPGVSPRFVGREVLVQSVLAAVDNALTEQRSMLLTLVGAPGVGRSRLLAEVGDRLAARSELRRAIVASTGHHTATSYGLAALLIRSLFDVDEADDPATIHDRLMTRLRQEGAVHQGIAPCSRARRGPAISWAPRAGADDEPESAGGTTVPPIGPEDAAEQLERILGVVPIPKPALLAATDRDLYAERRTVAALTGVLSSMTPIVVLCDDIHLADDASLELLDELTSRLRGRPWVLIATAEPIIDERCPRWIGGGDRHVRIQVTPLAQPDIEQMARDGLQRVADLPDDAVKAIAERAAGRPLALVQLLRLLVDLRVVEPSESSRWVLHGARIAEANLPTELSAIAEARLERVDESARALLQCAAVVGRSFWPGAVAELAAESASAARVDAELASLVEAGVLGVLDRSYVAGEREHVFALPAMQAVVYDRLRARVRAQLHERAATWLTARTEAAAGASDAHSALIAEHQARARNRRPAAEGFVRAGRHAAVLGHTPQAIRHFLRAREIHVAAVGKAEGRFETDDVTGTRRDVRVADWQQRARLQVELGDMFRRLARRGASAQHEAEAERHYDGATEEILRFEERRGQVYDHAAVLRWEAAIDHRRALVRRARGELPAARSLVERAIDACKRAGATLEPAPMLALLGSLHFHRRDYEACRKACRRGLRACRDAPNRDAPPRGTVSSDDAPPRDALWREYVADLLVGLGAASSREGQDIIAERCYRQAARALDERASPYEASRIQSSIATVLYIRGNVEGARDHFLRALELAARAGDQDMTMSALTDVAEVEQELGRPEVALPYAREAVRLGEELGAHADLPEMHRALADSACANERIGEAVAAAARALKLAKRYGAHLSEVARTAASVCAVAATWELDGDDEAARVELRKNLDETLESFTTGELAAVAQECREILGEAPSER